MRGKPALFACLAFAAGVVIARYGLEEVVPAHVMLWGLCSWLVVSGALLFVPRAKGVIGYALLVALVAAGALRYLWTAGVTHSRSHIVHLAKGEGQVALLRGVAISAPDQRQDYALVKVQASEVVVATGAVRVQGKVLLRVPTNYCPIRYGDSLEVQGVLTLPPKSRNPGGFDYREYLRAQGIHALFKCRVPEDVRFLGSGHGSALLRKVVYPLRERIVRTVDRSLTGDQAAFLKALLVGERGEIRLELRQAFANTGVVHVLAVSGLHVGFVVLIVNAVARVLRVPVAIRPVAMCVVLVLFVLITEARPPVVRATIMAGVLLLSTSLRRGTNVYNSLGVAGLIVLLVNPFELFQAGCQLSFAAVASIVSLYARLQELWGAPLLRAVERNSFLATAVVPLLLVSMAAQLGTLPLTAYYFARVPLLSLVANLVVVPAVGLVVALGYTTVLLAPLCWPLAKLYAACNWLVLTALLRGVEWMGNLPWAYVGYHQPRLLHAVAYYAVLCLALARDARWRSRAVQLLVAVACCAVWADALRPRGLLQVTILDVGQGDATCIRFPSGKTLLVDAGPADSTWNAGRTVVEPFLRKQGVRRLDGLLITHPHSDHYGGAPHLLRSLRVRQLYAPAQSDTAALFRELRRLADSLHVPQQEIQAGDELSGWDPALVFVLHPSPRFVGGHSPPPYGVNNTSAVLLVAYGPTRILMMGDAEIPAEEALLRYGGLLRSQVLKVGHHGSNLSSGEQFLEAVRPEMAVVSVGAGNPHGLPSRSVLQRLQKAGARVMRTDQEGAIVLTSNGQQWQLVRWRSKFPPLHELLSW